MGDGCQVTVLNVIILTHLHYGRLKHNSLLPGRNTLIQKFPVSPDNLTTEQRRKVMQSVRAKDSQIEIRLRKALWHKGYRFRKNYDKVYGKPDIVFVSLKIAVFCDSEFWHGYNWDDKKHEIKSNREFWWSKIERNIKRDIAVNQILNENGWLVIRFWGNEIIKDLDKCTQIVEAAIKNRKNLI